MSQHNAKFRIVLSNSNDEPIIVQVEPWANPYRLRKGEKIEIAAECKDADLLFDIEESGDLRILTLMFSDEYFLIREGKTLHWTEFASNIDD
jgi:hypothetical protein